ncbi:hypothetical protein ER308_18480 [Egibacter rhizosphaerae]|uniref:Uncharacterized protein n=1 Tax=Egibacter rhizosphaerae TaxID=1670831 RepID=A0A411YJG6_9ACTN|nr:hypothetical protein ER308_18480 [Egibacter rhizosphaerae]
MTRDQARYGYWRAPELPSHGHGDLDVPYVASPRQNDARFAGAIRDALAAHRRLRVRTTTDSLAARQHAGVLRPDFVVRNLIRHITNI